VLSYFGAVAFAIFVLFYFAFAEGGLESASDRIRNVGLVLVALSALVRGRARFVSAGAGAAYGGRFVFILALVCCVGILAIRLTPNGWRTGHLRAAAGAEISGPADVERAQRMALEVLTRSQLQRISAGADRDDPAALLEMGERAFAGIGGVEKSRDKAIDYFRRAAEAGSTKARIALARDYLLGDNNADKAEARCLLSAAAADDDSEARQALAAANLQPASNLRARIRQAEGDPGAVARLLRTQSDLGDGVADALLGRLLAMNPALAESHEAEAREFFDRALATSSAGARTLVASYYALGLYGLPRDDAEAARLYRLASDAGEPVAREALAAFYDAGRGGLSRDQREAMRLLGLAADGCDARAAYELALSALNGSAGAAANAGEAVRPFQAGRLARRPRRAPATDRNGRRGANGRVRRRTLSGSGRVSQPARAELFRVFHATLITVYCCYY
jgi:TPR repeat protein